MSEAVLNRAAEAQIPPPGALFLDHLAHWVPDRAAAEARLRQLGFTPTPFSEQFLPGPDGVRQSAGTGNHCLMLGEGYIEVLATLADTANAATLRRGMARYVGLHLIAFGCRDAEAQAARLSRVGFAPLPTVHLSREVDTVDGPATARFSVCRLAPAAMAEGRVQLVAHHTPEAIWQPRHLVHANGAEALTDVLVAVDSLSEASGRYARFLGRAPVPRRDGAVEFALERGRLIFGEPAHLAAWLPGMSLPALPFIAGYGIRVDDLRRTRAALREGGVAFREPLPGVVLADGGPALGGTIAFRQRERAPRRG
ncbi:MAG: VOC family protein [Thalassobaculales bacterium]